MEKLPSFQSRFGPLTWQVGQKKQFLRPKKSGINDKTATNYIYYISKLCNHPLDKSVSGLRQKLVKKKSILVKFHTHFGHCPSPSVCSSSKDLDCDLGKPFCVNMAPARSNEGPTQWVHPCVEVFLTEINKFTTQITVSVTWYIYTLYNLKRISIRYLFWRCVTFTASQTSLKPPHSS